jgi:hypothetical protein
VVAVAVAVAVAVFIFTGIVIVVLRDNAFIVRLHPRCNEIPDFLSALMDEKGSIRVIG